MTAIEQRATIPAEAGGFKAGIIVDAIDQWWIDDDQASCDPLSPFVQVRVCNGM